MSSIDKLASVTTLALADFVALFSQSAGNDVRATLATLIAFVQSQLTAAGDFITQYAAPNASAFNIAIAPPTPGADVFLILTPTGGFAAGTVTLPAQATCVDGQEVLCSCTQLLTALTIAGNGSVVNNPPTAFTAAVPFFNLRFDGVAKAWYRVG
jgi:hypothetical protein